MSLVFAIISWVFYFLAIFFTSFFILSAQNNSNVFIDQLKEMYLYADKIITIVMLIFSFIAFLGVCAGAINIVYNAKLRRATAWIAIINIIGIMANISFLLSMFLIYQIDKNM